MQQSFLLILPLFLLPLRSARNQTQELMYAKLLPLNLPPALSSSFRGKYALGRTEAKKGKGDIEIR
jgi:hypothetical protein